VGGALPQQGAAGRAERGHRAEHAARLPVHAITSDPGWNGGEHTSHKDVDAGLRRHAGIRSVLGVSTEFWRSEFWRRIEVPDHTFTSLAGQR